MSLPVDVVRLRATLGVPALTRVVDALCRRVELGRPLTGRLSLDRVTADERLAVDEMLGRAFTRGDSLLLDLDLLEETLRESGISGDLRSALEALRGPLVDRRAADQERAAAWSEVWRHARVAFEKRQVLIPWLDELNATGLLKRLSADNPEEATGVIAEVASLAEALPVQAEPLASFAARLFGNAHGLDPGTPRATLAVRAAARLGAVAWEDDAEGRRTAWASVGVMSDELSVPALVFNLPTQNDTLLGGLLRAAQAHAEPLHLSLRLLLRSPLNHDVALAHRDVYVCENPTIVALAVNQLGARCAPLVCVNGQFATPSLVLLRQLQAAGARLWYHGDFDPGGLTIARRVFAETEAKPWHYGTEDYLTAPKGIPFEEEAGPTPWSPDLRTVMNQEKRAVHEEAVFTALASDLGGARRSRI